MSKDTDPSKSISPRDQATSMLVDDDSPFASPKNGETKEKSSPDTSSGDERDLRRGASAKGRVIPKNKSLELKS